MAILTTEQKVQKIIELEILYSHIKNSGNYNKSLQILRKIQKLQNSL